MSLFRDEPTRIYYGESRTAAIYDEYSIAVGVAAGMLGVAWFCVWPTCKRKRDTLLVNAAYAEGIFVFVIAILGLVTKSWQRGTLLTSAPYAAYSGTEINATVGLYMGLDSFNVTLVGEPIYQNTSGSHGTVIERVQYNEIIQFGVRQGRNGFNEYSNTVNQEYRRMQGRGLPYPIAWVVELFTNDGDGMRWGRTHRQAGYYAHVLLWTSVPLWAVTLATLAAGLWGISGGLGSSTISTQARLLADGGLSRTFLLKSQLRPAAVLCMCTGLLQFCAPLFYAAIVAFSPGTEVRIHFSLGDLVLHYGWTFWLTLFHGALLLLLGFAATCWCCCGYDSGVKRLDYVWEDLARDLAHGGGSGGLTYGSGVSGVKQPHGVKHSRSAGGSRSMSGSHAGRRPFGPAGDGPATAALGSSQSKAAGYTSLDLAGRSSATPADPPSGVEMSPFGIGKAAAQQQPLPAHAEYPSPSPPFSSVSASRSGNSGGHQNSPSLAPVQSLMVSTPGGGETTMQLSSAPPAAAPTSGGASIQPNAEQSWQPPLQVSTPSSQQLRESASSAAAAGPSLTPVSIARPPPLGMGSVLEPIADVESEASPVSGPASPRMILSPNGGGGGGADVLSAVPAAAALRPSGAPALGLSVTPSASTQLPLYTGSALPLSSTVLGAEDQQHFVFAPLSTAAAFSANAASSSAAPEAAGASASPDDDVTQPTFH